MVITFKNSNTANLLQLRKLKLSYSAILLASLRNIENILTGGLNKSLGGGGSETSSKTKAQYAYLGSITFVATAVAAAVRRLVIDSASNNCKGKNIFTYHYSA